MRPLVSVNVTTCNRAHLLPRCIDSILSQSYPNLEIVIVDDASEDGTKEIVSSYQSKDERIKYYRHESNKGLAFARNTAWRNSSGVYIAFMDDDDEWIDPDKLKKQVALFENSELNNVAIICSSVRLHSTECDYVDKVISPPGNIKAKILQGNGIIYSPTVLTKKSILREVGGFDENIPRGVDSEYYRSCIVRGGYEVIFMPQVTTAVHEYGNDRMTWTKGRTRSKQVVKTHLYIIYKYLGHLFCCPFAFGRRLKGVAFGVYGYLRG